MRDLVEELKEKLTVLEGIMRFNQNPDPEKAEEEEFWSEWESMEEYERYKNLYQRSVEKKVNRSFEEYLSCRKRVPI